MLILPKIKQKAWNDFYTEISMLFLYHNDKIKCLKLRLTCIVVKGHAVDIILDRLLLLCNALSVVMML